MSNMIVRVTRDCDSSLKLRKVEVCIYTVYANEKYESLLDRTRMFAGPFFARRLARRIRKMKARARIMLGVSMEPLP